MTNTVEERELKISDQIKIWSPEEVAIIKATVAKGLTDLELAYFLNVSKVYKLNPFTKEIWCYKDLQGNIITFAGRDGFLAKAQRDPRWNGIASDVVREGETFNMNVGEGEVSHKKDITSKSPILGAYAICRPKGCEISTIEWADFETYNKGKNVWKADPEAMIKKVAEVHALKKAYGISGLQAEEDYEVKNGNAITMDHEQKPTLNALAWADELIRRSNFDDDTKEIFTQKLCDQELTNIELENIIMELRNNQPKEYK
jgi:phage recombination protein Bet